MVSETKISKGYRTVVPAELRKAYGILPTHRFGRKEEEIKVGVKKSETFEDIRGVTSVGGRR